jgi:GTPase
MESTESIHNQNNQPTAAHHEDAKVVEIDESHLTNLRVGVLGNVDSGKSTLTGVLSSPPGTLDDGRGLMRTRVFNFQHEQKNGRTSSVGHEIIGFTSAGEQYVTPISHTSKKNKIWPDVVSNSSKIIHLLDMCGHEKYLKTTMHGLTSLFPDFGMLVVGANMGVSKMTKEHLGISCALGLPLFVVITKIDIAPEEVFLENLKKISKILKVFCQKVPVQIKTEEDVAKVIEPVATGKVSPIFTVSSCTGENIDLLRLFMSKLNKSNN